MDRQIKKKSWLRKNYISVLLGTAFIAFVLIKVVFADHSSKFTVETDKISMGEVVKDTFKDYISLQGITEPIRTVALHPLVGGQGKRKNKRRRR